MACGVKKKEKTMKKLLTKILSFALLATFALGTVFGCGAKESDENHPMLPDYSAANKSYDFFAYSGPMSGTFWRDGEQQVLGPDQRTKEGYTVYKEAGFNIAFPNGTAAFNGGDWKTSESKRVVEAAKAAGIDRFIILDGRLVDMVMKGDELVGPGKFYENEEALYQRVKECLSDYIDEPTFYGVSMRDEPSYKEVNALISVYNAVIRAATELGKPDIYVHMTLMGYFAGTHFGPNKSESGKDYLAYLDKIVKGTNPKVINSDVYISRSSVSGNKLCENAFTTAQAMLNVCKESGTSLSFCLQSFAMYEGSTLKYRRVSKSEMMLEMYMFMGMGVKQFAYYTYQPAEYNSGLWKEEGGFLTTGGEKTNVYYYGKDLMSYAQSMADVIQSYSYLGGKFYFTDGTVNFDNSPYLGTELLKYDNSYEFNLVKNVAIDNDVVFMTELKDESNDLYMYMVQNVIDPSNGDAGNTDETVSVTFDASYTWVAELKDGRLNYVKLNNGVYTKTLSAGHAAFIIPLK